MIDLNSIQSIFHLNVADLENNPDLIDREQLEIYRERLKDQYIDLNNLGKDLISDIDVKYLPFLYSEMLEYVNDNYVSIINIDESQFSDNVLYEVGEYVYKFICIDCFNSTIPKYLDKIGCVSLDQFEIYFKTSLNDEVSNFKTSFIKIINETINELLKLQTIDKNVSSDINYKLLLKRYGFYSELINYGDSSDFLNNYFIPVLNKNQDDILWRMK